MMRAAPEPESVREAEKVLLVDRVHDVCERSLDDLIAGGEAATTRSGTSATGPLPERTLGVAAIAGTVLIGEAIARNVGIFRQEGNGDEAQDKQEKGRPRSNTAQNKQVRDAAREVGLDRPQREKLRREVEN